jgi:subtilisin family serine protease
VAVVDEQIQISHPDLSANYDSASSKSFQSPTTPYTSHGTNVAGVVAAARNSVCGVGVAYKSKFSSIALLGVPVSDATEAAALLYMLQRNHIYVNSWGPTDDGMTLDAPGM